MENSSAWTELFARDNREPRGNNADDAQRWHGGSDGRLLGRALEGKALACHESAEYVEAAAHRKKDGASELEIVIVESI